MAAFILKGSARVEDGLDAVVDAALAGKLVTYAGCWPQEAATVDLFRELLGDAENPFLRQRVAGHFTASCWLVDRAQQRVLLTHHRKLGLWLQLGGHADGQRDLHLAALREAEEESGLGGLHVVNEIFDLDRHWIPEHKGVPAHWHYDVRYVVHAGDDETYAVSEESLDLAWRDIAELADDETADPSVRRMAGKWLARG
ncbi:MAG: NUDIX hydrolase [Xanthomonadaceae bacterium]|nr:NUDIX hydrolase [Xanthomonadaceae bacterium]